VVNGHNLLLILIRQMEALVRRALAEVCTVSVVLVMAALHCGFFFFLPRLISAVADWMSTILLHMVWP